MQVYDGDTVILIGHRNKHNGLWHVNLAAPAFNAVRLANSIGDPTTAELVTFAHSSLFLPVLSTLKTALSIGWISNFPGLTLLALRKNTPRSIPMAEGHQDQVRKNQRSTQPPPTVIAPDTEIPDDITPAGNDGCSHALFAAVIEPTGQIYSDQTGQFVIPSSNGNNYLMVVYDYDSNHIFAQPFRNRTAKCILDAYKIVHAQLVKAGLCPRLQCLNNECSTILKDFLHTEDVDYQLVPPGVHRCNAAEGCIRTFQNHFIAGLCSVDAKFPLHLWDRLVPQVELTLNLLRGSRINPKLSAWAQVNGSFDFNRTPIGPPGTCVLAHKKPSNGETWLPHALDGWYVGPALDSYRCYNVWLCDTYAVRICDTLTWYPTKVRMPASSSNDIIIACLKDIAQALQHPAPASALAPHTNTQTKAHLDLITLLTNITAPPLQVPPVDNKPIHPIQQGVNTLELLRVPCTPPIPSLRVPAPPANAPTAPAPVLIEPEPEPEPMAAPDACPTPVLPAPPHTQAVRFNVVPETYAQVTGPHGRSHRRAQRKQDKARSSAPLPAPDAPRPPTPQAPPAPPQRRGMRKRQPMPKARSALSKAMLSSNELPPEHWACHGTAINPDTGNIAKYR
jgi:hypothetical protein